MPGSWERKGAQQRGYSAGMNTESAVPIGWVLGLGGAAIGIAGGLFGTYASIRATQSARERVFVVRASLAFWAAMTAFATVLLILPVPYRHFLWIPYVLGLPVAITLWNRAQSRIREEEIRAKAALSVDQSAAVPPV